jgi:hypothetical protein
LLALSLLNTTETCRRAMAPRPQRADPICHILSRL